MSRLLAKILCVLVDCRTSATPMIDFASAQTRISGYIVDTVTDASGGLSRTVVREFRPPHHSVSSLSRRAIT